MYWIVLVDRFASAVIMEIAYGHRIETDDDRYLTLSEQVNQAAAGAGDAGVSLVDLLPICK